MVEAGEEAAQERAIQIVSSKHGSNLTTNYTCVLNQLETEEP